MLPVYGFRLTIFRPFGEHISYVFDNFKVTSYNPNVPKHLSLLHDKYVIISADKTANNIVFACKSLYIDCLIKELGIDNNNIFVMKERQVFRNIWVFKD
jgi:hypothetical protein